MKRTIFKLRAAVARLYLPSHLGWLFIKKKYNEKPSSLLFWLLGLYFAAFGIASNRYENQLDRYEMRQSMSRPGKCGDNAVAESFFRTIKTESLYHMDFGSREHARLEIFDYIEGFYNRTRMHSTLDYRSPEEYERLSAA